MMIFGNSYWGRIKKSTQITYIITVRTHNLVNPYFYPQDTKPEKIISLTQLGKGHCRGLG